MLEQTRNFSSKVLAIRKLKKQIILGLKIELLFNDKKSNTNEPKLFGLHGGNLHKFDVNTLIPHKAQPPKT